MSVHAMLDFETFGTKPDTVVLSLGAVTFTKDEIMDRKHWYFSLEQQLKAKRSVSGSTLVWWLEQGDSAKTIFNKSLKEGLDVKQVMLELSAMLMQRGKSIKVWSCGAGFDVPIAENIMSNLGIFPPWEFRNIRCYRTVKAMHGIEKGAKREGVKHDALDDSIYQAQCLMNFFKNNPNLEH